MLSIDHLKAYLRAFDFVDLTSADRVSTFSTRRASSLAEGMPMRCNAEATR